MSDAGASLNTPGLGRELYVDMRDFGVRMDGLTDNSTVVQRAVSQAAGLPLYIPPGVLGISTNLAVGTVRRLIGAGRDVTTVRLLSAAGVCVISDGGSSLSGFELADLTIDGNWLGMGVLLTHGGHDGVTLHRIRVKQCVYVASVGIGWPCAIGAAGGAVCTNVQVLGCRFGPNEGWNETLILINTDTAVIQGSIIRDSNPASHVATPTNGQTGLAIWAYCNNITITGNAFENNWHEDVYFQESSNIVYVGNTHIRANNAGGGLSILNCAGVEVGPNVFVDPYGLSTGVSCFDIGGPTFNGFNHLFTSSFDIQFSKTLFKGFGVAGILYQQPSTPAGGQGSATTNLSTQHDVIIDGCIFDNMAGGPPIQIGNALQLNMARFTIRNCAMNGGNYGGLAGIDVRGNGGFGNTTTTQAIAGLPYGTTQPVTLAAIPAGLVTGQYIHLHDGVNPDYEVEVQAINGNTVTGYFTGNMNNGATVSQSTLLVNNGITDLLLENNTVQAATVGDSSGYLASRVTRARLLHNDFHNAAAGAGAAWTLQNGAAAQYVHGNIGLNPYGGAVPTPAFPAASGSVVNNTGFDVMVNFFLNGAAGVAAQISDVNGANFVTLSTVNAILPAGATFKVGAYTGGPPTWTWFGL